MCTEQVTREMQNHHDDAKKRLMDIAAYETPQEAQERFKSVCYYGYMYTHQGFVWIDMVGCSAFNEYFSGCHCFVKRKWYSTRNLQIPTLEGYIYPSRVV